MRVSWATGIKTNRAHGFVIVSNAEISCTEILYIIRTDQEGDSQYDVLQEIKEATRLEKTD